MRRERSQRAAAEGSGDMNRNQIEIRWEKPLSDLVIAAVAAVAGLVFVGIGLHSSGDKRLENSIIGAVLLVVVPIFLVRALQASRWRLTVNKQTGEVTFCSLTKSGTFPISEADVYIELVDHKISSKYPLVTEQLVIVKDHLRIVVELGFPADDAPDPYRRRSMGIRPYASELLEYLEKARRLDTSERIDRRDFRV